MTEPVEHVESVTCPHGVEYKFAWTEDYQEEAWSEFPPEDCAECQAKEEREEAENKRDAGL